MGYIYDAENRLVEVNDGLTSANDVYLEIEYDAFGRRVLTVEYDNVEDPCGDDDPNYPVATRHIYLGLTPIEEYQQADCPSPTANINWSLAREFLWGTRFPEPLAMIDWTAAGDLPAGSDPAANAEWLYYLRDRLGSVVSLVAAGRQSAATGGTPAASEPQLVERYVYDPYGMTYIESWDQTLNSGAGGWKRVDQSEYGNPWMWTGQRYDAGVGLYHFAFRSYSTKLGRWLQRDPLGYVDGVNLSGYLAGRAVRMADPLGLLPGDPWRNSWEDGFKEADKRSRDAVQDLDTITTAAAVVGEIGNGVINVTIAGISMGLPGPDDVLWAAVLSKHGIKVVKKGGEWVFEKVGGWFSCSRQLGPDDMGDVRAVIAEYQQAGGRQVSLVSTSANKVASNGDSFPVTRYVSEGEARVARETGVIPNTTKAGDPKEVFVTPDAPVSSVAEAESAYKIGAQAPSGPSASPTHVIVGNGSGIQFNYAGSVRGGAGTEMTTSMPIPVITIYPIPTLR